MKIIDLDDMNKPLYFICLEDWSDEVKEAGNHKQIWYEKMKDKGLRVKLAIDDNGTVGGMIQYIPIEHSMVEGKDLYFILLYLGTWSQTGKRRFSEERNGFGTDQSCGRRCESVGCKRDCSMGFVVAFFHASIMVQKTWI